MEVNFLHNSVFLFAPLCPDGTLWPRSNGCSALLSQTSHSPVIIRRSITHTGRGEGTLANSLSCRDPNQGGNREAISRRNRPCKFEHPRPWRGLDERRRNHKGR